MSIRRALKDQGIVHYKPTRFERFMNSIRLNKNYKTFRFRTHGTLQSAQRVMPEKLFEQYIKFSVVRNPWTRLVSEYEYFKQGSEMHVNVLKRRRHAWVKNVKTFEEFVYRKAEQTHSTQFDYVKNIGDTLGIDIILKQESLSSDFSQLCQRLGLKCELKRHNVTRNQMPLEHYYNSRLIDYVSSHWGVDIEHFEYKLPDELLSL